MYAKVNGVDLFFDVDGKQYVPDGSVMRKKPVCIVLHGGPGCSHYHFLPAFSQLSEDMQLIFVDHRCSGLSGKAPIETCSMEQNADDVEALRQYLGLGKVFIMGQSYGGMVAQKYALKYQENIQGLILLCTAPNSRYFQTAPKVVERRGTQEQVDMYYNSSSLGLMNTEEGMRKMFHVMGSLYHYHYDEKAVNDGFARAIYAPDVIAQQRGPNGEMRTFDFLPELHKIKCPTLVIGAKEDHATPVEHSFEIAEAITQSELVIIPESGHEIGDDRPEITFPTIRNFVARYDK